MNKDLKTVMHSKQAHDVKAPKMLIFFSEQYNHLIAFSFKRFKNSTAEIINTIPV